MIGLRCAALTLMMFLMMPWGAYAGPPASSASIGWQSATEAAPDRDTAELRTHPAPVRIELSVQKRCKGPALPGRACGPDLLLEALSGSRETGIPAPSLSPTGSWGVDGRSEAPPLTPPRSF